VRNNSIVNNFVRHLCLILILLLVLMPFFWLIATSFKPMSERLFTIPPRLIPLEPTTGNYREAFSLLNMLRSTMNSFIITLSAVALNLFFCSLTAYPLSRMNFPGRDIILYIILASFMIPVQAIIVPLFVLIQGQGLVDSYIGVFLPLGITAFGIFLLRNAFLDVPGDLEEAGRVDGCSEFKIFYRIMLPLIKPSLAALAILLFVTYWNEFLWPMIVLRSLEIQPLQVRLVNLSRGLFGADWRVLSAAAVLVTLPAILFFFIFQRFFISGMMEGALKE